MRDNPLSIGFLFSFLLVLTRVAGVFVFVPVPGVKNAPEVPKIVFVLAATIVLYPLWPQIPNDMPTMGRLLTWMLTEALLGLLIGLVVAFLTESFVFAAQMAASQAGYSYASTIDPTTQADSGTFPILLQLISGLLFFAVGVDRWIFKILGESLSNHPPGSMIAGASAVDLVVRAGAAMLSTGLRLALPVIALLLLVDIAMALLGRVTPQLQLLTLAFPLKMLAALATMAALATILPAVYEKAAARAFEDLRSVMMR